MVLLSYTHGNEVVILNKKNFFHHTKGTESMFAADNYPLGGLLMM